MKKIIAMLLSVILCFGLAACGDGEAEQEAQETTKPEEVKITDCVDRYEVLSVEDGVIYWDIYFNEKFSSQDFDGLDFYNCIKECFEREESKAEGIKDYSIHGTDSNGTLRFAWGFTFGDYNVVHEYHDDGTPEKNNYSLTSDMLNELLAITEE